MDRCRAVRRAGSRAQPSLSGGAVGDSGGVEPRNRGDDAEEEPLARRHPPSLRCPASRRGDDRARDSGHDRAADALRPRRCLFGRCGRAGAARVRIPAVVRPALAAGPARSLSATPRGADGSGVPVAPPEPPGRSTRSWLEDEFLPFLRRHGFPRPRLNVWLEVGGNRSQVDCLWPGRVVVELDGFAAHGTRIAFVEDRARDRRLRVAGYGVIRIAPEQLEDEAEEIAADLRHLLAIAAEQAG